MWFDAHAALASIDAPPADPIAHLFEDVPAVRKFVGGKVYRSTSIHVDVGLAKITNHAGGVIYASPNEARLLIAALQAAIKELEAPTPEEK
jgi:hypothetical protein